MILTPGSRIGTSKLFPQAICGITGTGRDMFPLCTLGLAMGCDLVRVGLEDSIHLPNGKPTRNNQEMVEAVVKIAALFGRTPMSVDEARARFLTV